MKETYIPASSNLAQVEYDSDEKLLTITFQGGRSWEYAGVPYNVFLGLQTAKSAGSYFYRSVRGVYPEQEV